jgi:hypothetical protein
LNAEQSSLPRFRAIFIFFGLLCVVGCGKNKDSKEYLRAAENLTGIKVSDFEKVK